MIERLSSLQDGYAKLINKRVMINDELYELLEQIEGGAYGFVFRAVEVSTGNAVAIKVPRLLGEEHEDNRLSPFKKFIDEVELHRRTKESEGVVELVDACVPQGIASLNQTQIASGMSEWIQHWIDNAEQNTFPGCLITKFARNGSVETNLNEMLEWRMERKVLFCRELARCVWHIHEMGLIHSDLKPANVLIDEGGAPRIADFGITVKDEERANLEERLGTKGYKAPEHYIENAPFDHRADLFSLGVIIYELLTGHHPLQQEGFYASVLPTAPDEFRIKQPSEYNPLVSGELNRVCMDLLIYDPAYRIAAAGEVVNRLDKILEQSYPKPELFEGHLNNLLRNDKFVGDVGNNRPEFISREWMIDDLLAEIKSGTDSHNGVIVAGDYGIGKSTLIAEMVRLNNMTRYSPPFTDRGDLKFKGKVLAYHFCRRGNGTKASTAWIIENLAKMLRFKIPEYERQFVDRDLNEISAIASEDLGRAFSLFIIEPLTTIFQAATNSNSVSWFEPEEFYFLVVDGLDETVIDGQSDLIDLLNKEVNNCPANLRILTTIRTGTEQLRIIRNQMRGYNGFSINDERIREDVKRYFRGELGHSNIEKARTACGIQQRKLLADCTRVAGNKMLVAFHLCRALRIGALQPDSISSLPPGMDGVYLELFRHHFDQQHFDSKVRPILEVLVAAFLPVQVDQITAATDGDLEKHEVVRLLGDPLSQYLVETDNGSYRFQHTSFPDWLTDSRENKQFWINEPDGHRRLAESCTLQRENAGAMTDLYCKKYEVEHYIRSDHLASSTGKKKAVELIKSPNYFFGRFLDRSDVTEDFVDRSIAETRLLAKTLSCIDPDHLLIERIAITLATKSKLIREDPALVFPFLYNELKWLHARPKALVMGQGKDEPTSIVRAFCDEWRAYYKKHVGKPWFRSITPDTTNDWVRYTNTVESFAVESHEGKTFVAYAHSTSFSQYNLTIECLENLSQRTVEFSAYKPIRIEIRKIENRLGLFICDQQSERTNVRWIDCESEEFDKVVTTSDTDPIQFLDIRFTPDCSVAVSLHANVLGDDLFIWKLNDFNLEYVTNAGRYQNYEMAPYWLHHRPRSGIELAIFTPQRVIVFEQVDSNCIPAASVYPNENFSSFEYQSINGHVLQVLGRQDCVRVVFPLGSGTTGIYHEDFVSMTTYVEDDGLSLATISGDGCIRIWKHVEALRNNFTPAFKIGIPGFKPRLIDCCDVNGQPVIFAASENQVRIVSHEALNPSNASIQGETIASDTVCCANNQDVGVAKYVDLKLQSESILFDKFEITEFESNTTSIVKSYSEELSRSSSKVYFESVDGESRIAIFDVANGRLLVFNLDDQCVEPDYQTEIEADPYAEAKAHITDCLITPLVNDDCQILFCLSSQGQIVAVDDLKNGAIVWKSDMTKLIARSMFVSNVEQVLYAVCSLAEEHVLLSWDVNHLDAKPRRVRAIKYPLEFEKQAYLHQHISWNFPYPVSKSELNGRTPGLPARPSVARSFWHFSKPFVFSAGPNKRLAMGCSIVPGEFEEFEGSTFISIGGGWHHEIRRGRYKAEVENAFLYELRTESIKFDFEHGNCIFASSIDGKGSVIIRKSDRIVLYSIGNGVDSVVTLCEPFDRAVFQADTLIASSGSSPRVYVLEST